MGVSAPVLLWMLLLALLGSCVNFPIAYLPQRECAPVYGQGLRAPVASIGGAGTFDGIFVTGLLALLYAGFGVHPGACSAFVRGSASNES
jgi:uncharacterized membrane protein